MHHTAATYPTSDIIAKWENLPAPSGSDRDKSLAAGRAGSEQVMKAVIGWPKCFLPRAPRRREAREMSGLLSCPTRLCRRPPSTTSSSLFEAPGAKNCQSIHVDRACERRRQGQARCSVEERDLPGPGKDRAAGEAKPLKTILDEATIQRLGFGKGADGSAIDPRLSPPLDRCRLKLRCPRARLRVNCK